MAEYEKSDERGIGEASGQYDMQSSSDKWSPPSLEGYAISSIQSGMIFET